MKNRVLIILSIYHGEQFLDDQIQSLKDLDHEDWRCIIRDDGRIKLSNSKLSEILEDTRFFLSSTPQSHYGVSRSYGTLLKEIVNSDFTHLAFCDQDDIWEPKRFDFLKFEKASKHPTVYIGRANLINERGEMIGNTRRERLNKPELSLFKNQGIGCVMVVNKPMVDKLVSLLRNINFPVLHDWATFACGQYFGRVLFLDETWVKYRQHRQNDTGYETHLLKRLLKSIRKLNSTDYIENALKLSAFLELYDLNKEIESLRKKTPGFLFNRLCFIKKMGRRAHRLDWIIFSLKILLSKS
jgi:glycosyltransferase involved in cell wall biosynthesis